MEYSRPIIEEERLDKILLKRGLVSSRVRAERMIRETGVLVNGKLVTKTGKKFPIDSDIQIIEEEIPWVSRGALKLIKAIEQWKPDINNKIFLDIGASTGGFTEVLLANGASKVYAVDVGKDQLHKNLRDDPRVINLEKMHVRELNNNFIPEMMGGCVIDVSFISLGKIFPFIHALIEKESSVIALVKPQFEVGKNGIRKGGIVKDTSLYPTVIEEIIKAAKLNKLMYIAHCESPILGGDGNKEFLMHFRKT